MSRFRNQVPEYCGTAYLERFPRCSSTAIIFVSPQREQGPNHSCVSASGPCSSCGLHRLIMMPQHCGNRSKPGSLVYGRRSYSTCSGLYKPFGVATNALRTSTWACKSPNRQTSPATQIVGHRLTFRAGLTRDGPLGLKLVLASRVRQCPDSLSSHEEPGH